MDNKAFLSQLASKLDCDSDECAKLTAAFGSVLAERAVNLDSVAIPGFGNFVAIKQPERVAIKSDGKRMLLPPQIKIEFVASAMLKKQIGNE